MTWQPIITVRIGNSGPGHKPTVPSVAPGMPLVLPAPAVPALTDCSLAIQTPESTACHWSRSSASCFSKLLRMMGIYDDAEMIEASFEMRDR